MSQSLYELKSKKRKRSNKESKSSKKVKFSTSQNAPPSARLGGSITGVGMSVVPNRAVRCFKYCYEGLSNVTVPDTNVLRINSLFDPDFTFTGHQPYGHDLMQEIYTYYRVLKVGVDITASATGSTFSPYMVTAYTSSTSAALGSTLAAELPGARSYALTLSQPTRMQFNIPIHEVMGVTPAELKGDDTYKAIFGASPTNQAFLHFVTTFAGGATANVFYSGCLYIWAELTEPYPLGQA